MNDNMVKPVDVLVIDDNYDMRTILADLLSIEGYSVQTASNGVEAIHFLGSPHPPRLIVLDLLMPMLDGEDFLHIRNKYLRWSSVPVIVLTGLESPPTAGALGVSAVVRKPPAVPEMLRMIRRLCPAPLDSA